MAGAEVESALATGVATLKTFDPPLDALDGAGVEGCGGSARCSPSTSPRSEPLTLLIHLMSAGRLQLFDVRGSLKDRASRLLVRLDGRARVAPARVRHQAVGLGQAVAPRRRRRRGDGRDPRPGRLACAPARALRRADRPAPPPPPPAAKAADDRRHRPLLGGRDPLGGEALALQEGLGAARTRRSTQLHSALHVLGDALDHYEEVIGETVPDKLPMPLKVHRREGEPCPRCGTTIEAVFYSQHQTNYCPEEQTGGRVLKDRRLSRLLK